MKTVLQYAFVIALFVLIFSFVEMQPLLDALQHVTPGICIYLLLISVGLIYISALKWKLFLETFGSTASLLHLFNLYLVGYFTNLILPSFLGGDAVRSFYAGRSGGQHEAAAATILERYTGFVAMIVLGVIFSFWSPLITRELALVLYALACAVFIGSCLAVSERALALLSVLPFSSVCLPHLRKVQQGFQIARKDTRLLINVMLLSFLFHTVTVVNTMAAAAAVGWTSPPAGELFVVLPLILLLSALPIAPSGLGIQEGAFFYFLQAIGASPSEALGVGLILRAKSYVLACIGGIIWLFLKKNETPQALATESVSSTAES